MGDLRSKQLIGTFGPGSVYDLVDYSVVIASADQWLNQRFAPDLVINDIEIKEVVQKRLKELTDFNIPFIYGLMMPPYSRDDSDEHETAIGSVRAYRFPIYHRCSRCRVLCRLKNTSTETKCSHNHSNISGMEPCGSIKPDWKRGKLEPVRFITKCEDGHLQDFNWIAYKQLTCAGECKKHDRWGSPESIYYLNETSQGDFFNSIKIQCRICKNQSSLGKIKQTIASINNGGYEKLDPELKRIFSCNGWRPWLKDNKTESCSRTLDFVPRGQSNVYIPIRESYISIPKNNFTDFDLDHQGIIQQLFHEQDDLNDFSREDAYNQIPIVKRFYKEDISQAISSYHDQSISTEHLDKKIDEYLEDLIEWKICNEEITADEIEVKYKFNEFRSLTTKLLSDEFICEPINHHENDFLSVKFNSISKIEKLKIVNVLLGFQRSFNVDDEKIKFHPSINKPSYLPSSISWGEGIFLEFNFSEIDKWASYNKDFVETRNQVLNNRSKGSLQLRDIKNINYSLVHSFSHMLMKQLAYESGFSVTELTEKIYFFEDDQKVGLLIHTTSGDSQCSMGGLSDLADPNKLENIIKRGLTTNLSCSNDPLCADSHGQGTSSLSHAACFGCLMLPEICCEVRPIKNSYLDRNLLVNLHGSVKSFFE